MTRHVAAAARLSDRPGQRDVPRPSLFPGDPGKGGAASADLSFAQGLDCGLQRWRGALFPGHPVPGGGARGATLFYATDINHEALAKAEAGIFDLDRMQLFTENHRKSGGKSSLVRLLQRGLWQARRSTRSLRQRVVFSDHSLVTDAVFAEMHLISCRNVLIYFDRDLQDRAIGLFKDSLARKGFLGLGAKESLRFSAPCGHPLPNSCVRRRSIRSATNDPGISTEAVVIGASAGAVEALSAILPALPRRLSDCP